MTTEEKNILIDFLDLTADYLGDGHRRRRQAPQEPETAPCLQEDQLPEESLPLAYLVEEDDEVSAEEIPSAQEIVSQAASLEDISAGISTCKACALAATRTNTVSGEGVTQPLVMVIGEGPGADEDMTGRPFVGRAGQLLDKMLESIELSRKKNCFIANMVKCRPPGNRDPEFGEMETCFPFLKKQILLLRPKIIVCAGRVAAQYLLETRQGINALRGKFTELRLSAAEGEELIIPVLPIFHPSALLMNESYKRPTWEDLKLLKSFLTSQLIPLEE